MQAWTGDLIDLIGDARFGRAFGDVLHAHMHPDFVHIFRFLPDGPRVIESFGYDGTHQAGKHADLYREQKLWRFDEAMSRGAHAVSGQPLVLRQGSEAFADSNFRRYRRQHHLGERTMVIGRGDGSAIGFSLSWTKASPVTGRQASWFEQMVDLGFPLVRKHLEVRDQRRRLDRALSSLPQIEANLRGMIRDRGRREVEVGARLLFGESAANIGKALGIGKETVITHRKRLYDSIGVGCGRELLLWYLGNQSPGLSN